MPPPLSKMESGSRKRNRSRKSWRSLQEIQEEQTRTLYIRLPHTIKDADEVGRLLFGDYKVKLPRQSSRHCHAVFSNVEEKMKNLEAMKGKEINGKPVVVHLPKPIKPKKNEEKKMKQKKIKIPEPTEESKIGKYIFISNIPPGTKASEIRDAVPGSVTVGLLKGLHNGTRQARVKMSSSEACSLYVRNQSEWPTFKGQKIYVSLANKSKTTKRRVKKRKRDSETLKIYDGSDDETPVKKVAKSGSMGKNQSSQKVNVEVDKLEESGSEQDDENTDEDSGSSTEE